VGHLELSFFPMRPLAVKAEVRSHRMTETSLPLFEAHRIAATLVPAHFGSKCDPIHQHAVMIGVEPEVAPETSLPLLVLEALEDGWMVGQSAPYMLEQQTHLTRCMAAMIEMTPEVALETSFLSVRNCWKATSSAPLQVLAIQTGEGLALVLQKTDLLRVMDLALVVSAAYEKSLETGLALIREGVSVVVPPPIATAMAFHIDAT
jgi:hypothetical protein